MNKRNKRRVTPKQFEQLRDVLFMVFVYYQDGRYAGSCENVNFFQALAYQVEVQQAQKVAVIYEMRYHYRLPVIPTDHKLDPHTLGFKLAVLPLLMQEPYNPHLTWQEVEDFCRARGYIQERIDRSGAIEIGTKLTGGRQ